MASVRKWMVASVRKVGLSTSRAWKQPFGGGPHGKIQPKSLTTSYQPTSRNLITTWPLGLMAFRERTHDQAHQFLPQGANMLNFFSSNGRYEKKRTETTTRDSKKVEKMNMFTHPDLIKPGSVVWLPLHEATTREDGEGCLNTGAETKFVHSKVRPHIIARVYFKHYVAIPITSYGKSGSRGVRYRKDLPFHTRVRDLAKNWNGAKSNADSSEKNGADRCLGAENMPLYVRVNAKRPNEDMLENSLALMARPVTYNGDITFKHIGWLGKGSTRRFSARYKKLSNGLKGLDLQTVAAQTSVQ